jgi:Zn-finger nucleic acid-binding protein
MNCRNCGAAMEPVRGQSCFHCKFCGTFEFPQGNQDGVTVIGEVTKYSCPVCAKALTMASIEGHTVNYCENCHGFLTTNLDFAAILGQRREEVRASSSMPQPFGKDELKRRLSCPNCTKTMETYPYGGGGHVMVDSCELCNLIWLDADEMNVLARYRPKEDAWEQPDDILTS